MRITKKVISSFNELAAIKKLLRFATANQQMLPRLLQSCDMLKKIDPDTVEVSVLFDEVFTLFRNSNLGEQEDIEYLAICAIKNCMARQTCSLRCALIIIILQRIKSTATFFSNNAGVNHKDTVALELWWDSNISSNVGVID